MSDTAFQTSYRQELINGFEQQQSLMRMGVTTEGQIKGNSCVFDVIDSGGATAVTRGINGQIPPRTDNNTQLTCTLAEWHDLAVKSDFNVFASQGNQIAQMQRTTMAVINRKIDSDIITELSTGTVDTGSAQVASLRMITKSKAILGLAKVPFDQNIWCAITPAFEAYMTETKEFTDKNYVTAQPINDGHTAWADRPGYYQYLGIKFFVHPDLSGVGTSSAKCLMWHKNAIGHAVDVAGIDTNVGYDGKQAQSWCRCSTNMGSKLLQNSGVIVMYHDDSAMVGQ